MFNNTQRKQLNSIKKIRIYCTRMLNATVKFNKKFFNKDILFTSKMLYFLQKHQQYILMETNIKVVCVISET